jgi:hypothetical protein
VTRKLRAASTFQCHRSHARRRSAACRQTAAGREMRARSCDQRSPPERALQRGRRSSEARDSWPMIRCSRVSSACRNPARGSIIHVTAVFQAASRVAPRNEGSSIFAVSKRARKGAGRIVSGLSQTPPGYADAPNFASNSSERQARPMRSSTRGQKRRKDDFVNNYSCLHCDILLLLPTYGSISTVSPALYEELAATRQGSDVIPAATQTGNEVPEADCPHMHA